MKVKGVVLLSVVDGKDGQFVADGGLGNLIRKDYGILILLRGTCSLRLLSLAFNTAPVLVRDAYTGASCSS